MDEFDESDEIGRATQLLQRMGAGDGAAAEELLPLLYDELRRQAAAFMARERADHTLQPTALVHEAYLRLVGQGTAPDWESRGQFVRYAARAMRGVLVDHVRRRRAAKRGGAAERLPLDAVVAGFDEQSLDVLALDEALDRLTELDERLVRIVELRFFAGLSIADTASVLDVSTPTVERRWQAARLWLRRELGPGAGGDS